MTAPARATALVTERHEKHEVRVELDILAGVPVIADRERLATKYPIAPFKALITYTRGHQPRSWRVHARVYGRPEPAVTLMNGWADYYHHAGDDCDWPDWLSELADQQHPDRPGGWPGDDPTGSYL